MKLLTRVHLGGNRYEITIDVEPDEELRFDVRDQTGDIPEMGVVNVSSMRRVRESWLLPKERVYALEVETLETVGRLTNK